MAPLRDRRRHVHRPTAGFVGAPAALGSHSSPFARSLRRGRATPHAVSCRSSARRRARWQASTGDVGDDVDDVAHVPDTDATERQRRAQALESAGVASGIPVPGAATSVEVEFAPGRRMRFETGRVSRQANGAVIVRSGDTLVYCTACAEKRTKAEADFFPLRVDYAEKFSSTGRTPGSYIKREGRPSEREILISRLIDRPLRPMFPDGFFREVQVIANVFSYDGQNPADALAICGSAAALHISSLPLVEPVAGVRVSCIGDGFVVEPTIEEQKQSTADIVVAGTRTGILMIEGVANFLSEEKIMRAVLLAHEAIKKLCDGMDELRAKAGKEKVTGDLRDVPSHLIEKIESLMMGIDDALAVTSKQARDREVNGIRDRVFAELLPSRQDELDDPEKASVAKSILYLAWKDCVAERMRRRILDDGIRADGRGTRTVRPITIDQGVLPCAHGSSLFTRGETQALAVATLGGQEMAKKMETLEGEEAARFYLQYSFPPSSVGEVGRVGAPGRREIGHGKLAERALLPAIPPREAFPYILRVESNILESNGSSSMASVCGGCLALLEAGVPLTRHVAGIAMGLITDKRAGEEPTEERRSVVLTDILGLEDALGSCDAKFAGDDTGISALQLDVKLRGISLTCLSAILEQAREGRIHILNEMRTAMPAHRPELPDSVPRLRSLMIPARRIGELIGPAGKNIRSIIERCGGEDVIRITIENDGTVSFSSADESMLEKAMGIVRGMSVELSVGSKFQGRVTKTLPFGVYVEIAEGREGWLHISELENKRTNKVEDVCNVGDQIEVQVIEVGRNGQFKLSRRVLLPRSNTSSDPASSSDGEATVRTRKRSSPRHKPAADTKVGQNAST